MSSNSDSSSPIASTPISTVGKGRVDIIKSDFDALVQQKGYDVYHDKAHKCPCRNVSDNQANGSCRNCAGVGWLFTNRTETRMVIQSQSIETKYKEWSLEKTGTARITAFNETKLTYMDRVIVRNALMVNSENLHFKLHSDGKYRSYCRFNIKAVDIAYLYISPTEKLTVLTDQDYTIKDGQWIELTDEIVATVGLIDTEVLPTVSIRYEHHPQYHIWDITRQVIESYELTKSEDLERDKSMKFPTSAIGRLADDVLDQENFNEDYLFDNSFITCDQKVTVKINNQEVSINSFTQAQINSPTFNRPIGGIIYNIDTGLYEGWNGTNVIPVGIVEQIRETSAVTSLPTSFDPNTTLAVVNMNLLADLDVSSYLPTGLRDGSIVQIKKVQGAGKLTYTDPSSGKFYNFVNEVGEFYNFKYVKESNRLFIQ